MHCKRHPHNAAVATCEDCYVGLCTSCESKYSLHLCDSCMKKRVRQEKKNIETDFIVYVLCFGMGTMIFGEEMIKAWAEGQEFPVWAVLLGAYFFSGTYAGYRIDQEANERFGRTVIFWNPIYFIIILAFSCGIGFFLLPIRLFTQIKRYKELKAMQQHISGFH